jgi:acetoin utilization deacetylase AcuC-like enzyme
VTEQLVKVANQFSKGRIVSVLEGGYSTKSGPISPLAQSVAYHVRSLMHSNEMGLPSEIG